VAAETRTAESDAANRHSQEIGNRASSASRATTENTPRRKLGGNDSPGLRSIPEPIVFKSLKQPALVIPLLANFSLATSFSAQSEQVARVRSAKL
jgi:hypothetical protein